MSNERALAAFPFPLNLALLEKGHDGGGLMIRSSGPYATAHLTMLPPSADVCLVPRRA